ncbi:RNA polymerase subunit sigma-70 [Halobacteriales archaeon QH_2_65_14]|nr:MAG: RNA polymerase subunit sigma-70 [Halobacteriales archaeon QH_2_65_14]
MARDENSSTVDVSPVNDEDVENVTEVLSELGFDEESMVITRRQAEVLVMRDRGLTQATIADKLDTTRENVTGIEHRARENIEKARETVEFAEVIEAPVRIEAPAGTDMYEIPELVFDACDEAGIKVAHNAPELMKLISDGAGSAIEGRQVRTALSIHVTSEGVVQVRRS